jgi:transposase
LYGTSSRFGRCPLLPRYGLDLDPIEMAFAKLKTLIRKSVARTYDTLWQAVGSVCDLF